MNLELNLTIRILVRTKMSIFGFKEDSISAYLC